MTPNVFGMAVGSSAVLTLLGVTPTRFYMFGEADQNTVTPYAVWQLVYGTPENKLAGVPGEDTFGIQVDAYAKTASEARDVATALRDALEPNGYVVGWNGEGREPETRLFRFSFTIEFMAPRQAGSLDSSLSS